MSLHVLLSKIFLLFQLAGLGMLELGALMGVSRMALWPQIDQTWSYLLCISVGQYGYVRVGVVATYWPYLTLSSFPFQLAGMGVLGLALWLRMDHKVNNFVRASYEIDQVNTYYILCYIMMGAGCVLTFVGFLGCCGAFQESKCMLGSVSTTRNRSQY